MGHRVCWGDPRGKMNTLKDFLCSRCSSGVVYVPKQAEEPVGYCVMMRVEMPPILECSAFSARFRACLNVDTADLNSDGLVLHIGKGKPGY